MSLIENIMKESIMGRALENNLIDLEVVNIRDYTEDKHLKTDDYIYGGGAGMLMKVDVLHKALLNNSTKNSHVILTSPKAKPLSQDDLIRLSKKGIRKKLD